MAIVTYDRLMAYKPHRLHFDEVLKNPQDKLAGSAYGFSRVDIKKGYPSRVSTHLHHSHQA